MARFSTSDRERVDAQGRRWRDVCLASEGSLFFDERSVWHRTVLVDFQARFTDLGGDATGFLARLTRQLDDASDEVRWLAAEVLTVYALPVFELIGAAGKAELVRQALGGIDPREAPHWPDICSAFEQGYGNPGVRYNVRRDLQIEYLVDFARRLIERTSEERRAILDDPWRLEEFADASDPRIRGEMRHVVLHLLRPDDFERIFSSEHKRLVVRAFSEEVEHAGTELASDTDQALLGIRRFLESKRGADSSPVDFYISPYVEQWRSPVAVDDDGSPYDDDGPRWFWVNQGQTWKAEFAEGILWAPLLSKNGLKLHHWERMDELRPGDFVIHYSGAIRAISRVTHAAERDPKPAALRSEAWEEDGRLVRTSYVELAQAIGLNEIPATWRTSETGGPFTSVGAVQQGYLFSLRQGFAAQLLSRFDELREAAGAPEIEPAEGSDLSDIYNAFRTAVADSGLLMPAERVRAVLAALAAKPFVILSGLSGSGKTQLALRLGEWFGAGETERSLVVAVRPDWTGPESLFGYEDALRPLSSDGRPAWHVPDTLEFILAALRDPDHPYLLLLDEMNLAHVERYFSDFLSGVESGKAILPNLKVDQGAWRQRTEGAARVELPANLFVVGTVNVDETTYLFSPKVLDRAFTFEIRTATEELTADLKKPAAVPSADDSLLQSFARISQDSSWHLEHPHPGRDALASSLAQLHAALSESGDEFGHRVIYESLRFGAMLAAAGEPDINAALDQIVLLKMLPRIHGSRRRVEPVLRRLARFTENPQASTAELDLETPLASTIRLPRSRAKIDRMTRVLHANQFVSFSE